MQVDFYYPQNSILKKYIQYYYFLNRTEMDKEITYLGFPTTSVFVMACQNANFVIQNENIVIEENKNMPFQSVLFHDDKISGEMQYKGATNEITICFKPLGINAFLSKNFIDYKTNTISNFKFEQDFEKEFTAILNKNSNTEKINAIEKYLLANLKGTENILLEQILLEIHSTIESLPTISALAKKYQVSRPTINNLFKKHLGTNPNQYIKIVRFRNAIQEFTSNSNSLQLVDIAYITNYFDQSHMIKDFISLTGYSPKHFFERLTVLENGQINWMFL